MKYTLLPMLLIAAIGNLSAQRLVPVFESGYPIDNWAHGPDGGVHDLESHQGNLYFCGDFSTCNTINTTKIARWNGNNFYELAAIPGLQASNKLYCMKSFNDLLYVGGKMPGLNNILVYDGNTWMPVNSGFDGSVFDLEVFNNQLYACGEFLSSGATDLNRVAVLSPQGWVTVGTGFNNKVFDLQVFNGELYAAGEFTQTSDGMNSLNYLAKLNNNNWVNSGLNSDAAVFSLLQKDEALIIGGDFQSIENNAQITDRLAIFDGANFSVFSSLPDYVGNNPVTEIADAGNGYFITTASALFGIGSSYSGICQNNTYIENNRSGAVRVTQFHNDELFVGMAQTGDLLPPMANYLYSLVNGTYIGQSNNGTLNINCGPGSTHFNFDQIQHGFEIGSSTGLSTVYAASPWIYGKTVDEQLFVSAQTYAEEGEEAWYFGPVSFLYNDDYALRYMRTWELSKQEIDAHILNYTDVNYAAPEAIQAWPAHGNMQMGEPANLAPFIDVDADGIYQPQLGDYPDIRGDHAIYFILRDKNGSLTDVYKAGLELHVMLYTYEHPSESVRNTAFLNYRIINRSTQNYEECKLGMWTDFDIGNATDDYVGCDSTRNMFFGYNGDDFDEPGFSSPGFDNNIPAQGVTFLNSEMKSFMYYVNSSNPEFGSPSVPVHFYYYMNGQRLNQEGVNFGELFGLNNGSYPTDFMYPTCPFTNDEPVWNEVSSDNPPSDRRGVGSTGSFSLQSGEERCVDLAFIMAYKNENLMYEEVNQLKLASDSIQLFYQLMDFECYESVVPVNINEAASIQAFPSVYPNPGNGIYQLLPGDFKFNSARLFDISGREVKRFNPSQNLATINLLDQNPGVYLLQLLDVHEQAVYTLKLIHAAL